eukprot:TRINITY_DN8798_c0_g1_i2.p1 TRINITY_DN8798_c0_g1~~TRINITY_DN8798_c0_g1_i2.p1  ORF type:complete len:465 (-),score=97.80 TRINITY_DN8798_c0_g1_i2:41-1234(-)
MGNAHRHGAALTPAPQRHHRRHASRRRLTTAASLPSLQLSKPSREAPQPQPQSQPPAAGGQPRLGAESKGSSTSQPDLAPHRVATRAEAQAMYRFPREPADMVSVSPVYQVTDANTGERLSIRVAFNYDLKNLKKLRHAKDQDRNDHVVVVKQVLEIGEHAVVVTELLTDDILGPFAKSRRTEGFLISMVTKLLDIADACESFGDAFGFEIERLAYLERSAIDFEVKVCDLSSTLYDPVRLQYFGAVVFSSPESLMSSGFDIRRSALWTIAVFVTLIITGRSPFSHPYREQIVRNLVENFDYGVAFEQEATAWEPFPEAKDFVLKLLLRDPEERPSLAQARDHAWLQAGGATVALLPDQREQLLELRKRIRAENELTALSVVLANECVADLTRPLVV